MKYNRDQLKQVVSEVLQEVRKQEELSRVRKLDLENTKEELKRERTSICRNLCETAKIKCPHVIVKRYGMCAAVVGEIWGDLYCKRTECKRSLFWIFKVRDTIQHCQYARIGKCLYDNLEHNHRLQQINSELTDLWYK